MTKEEIKKVLEENRKKQAAAKGGKTIKKIGHGNT